MALFDFADPIAYQQQQAAAQQKAAQAYANQTPQQQADTAGYGFGGALRGLLGGKDEGLARVQQANEIMRGVDRNDPDALLAAAKKLGDAGNMQAGEAVYKAAMDIKAAQSKMGLEAAQTESAVANKAKYEAQAQQALAQAKAVANDSGLKNLPPEVQTILLMEQRDPTFDGKAAMAKFLTGKEKGEWSDPFNLSGATVQKNLKTGEIRTAVSRPPVTNINAGSPKAEKDAEKKEAARVATVNMADNNSYRAENAMQTAKEALGLVSWKTAGTGGKVFGLLPGTDAVTLREKAKTLEGILSFAELAKMRSESKTGGALGSIAVKELELLGKTVASLSQDVAPAELAKNIQRIYDHLAKYKETMDKIKTSSEQPSASNQDDAAIQWAKANPKDPRAAAILKANGM